MDTILASQDCHRLVIIKPLAQYLYMVGTHNIIAICINIQEFG